MLSFEEIICNFYPVFALFQLWENGATGPPQSENFFRETLFPRNGEKRQI